MKTGTCKNCGGETKEGKALNNPIFKGTLSEGTIMRFQGNSTALIPVMKCGACGHSYLPKVKADWEVRLDELILKLSA